MCTPYAQQVTDVVTAFDPQGANRYFLFGSSVRKDRYRDIDVAVVGNQRSHKELSDLRNRFYESTIPYTVDIVDFDASRTDFREYVLAHEPIVWIR